MVHRDPFRAYMPMRASALSDARHRPCVRFEAAGPSAPQALDGAGTAFETGMGVSSVADLPGNRRLAACRAACAFGCEPAREVLEGCSTMATAQQLCAREAENGISWRVWKYLLPAALASWGYSRNVVRRRGLRIRRKFVSS